MISHKVELAVRERLLSHLTERFDLALSTAPPREGVMVGVARHLYRPIVAV